MLPPFAHSHRREQWSSYRLSDLLVDWLGYHNRVRQRVAVPEDDAPLAVLESVALARTQCPLLRQAVDFSTHMFEVDGEPEIVGHARQEVLDAEPAEVQVL